MGISNNELIKIKLEIDVNPPKGATLEHRYRLLPAPYEIQLYDAPSLFAGKIHAVICRSWKNRVKGRDLYDLIFFISKNIPVNLNHLKERLIQTNTINKNNEFTLEDMRILLCEKFNSIDYDKAKEHVIPFIKEVDLLSLWNADFFKSISSQIIEIDK